MRRIHSGNREYKQVFRGACVTGVVFLMFLSGCSQTNPVSSEPEVDRAQTEATPVAVENEPFNIRLIGLDALPVVLAAYKLTILTAATTWEGVIVEGVPDVNHLFVVDDIDILVRYGTHADSTVIASAAATNFRTNADGTRGPPYLGVITIYLALFDDVGEMTGLGVFENLHNVMVHEIGHVLGFSDGFMDDKAGIETVAGTRFFNGPLAANAYREILYNVMGERLAFAIPDLRVPMEMEGAHWKYPEMKWDVMGPYFTSGSVMSLVTIQTMADLGYVVDVRKATRPPGGLTKIVAGTAFHCDGQHISGIGGE